MKRKIFILLICLCFIFESNVQAQNISSYSSSYSDIADADGVFMSDDNKLCVQFVAPTTSFTYFIIRDIVYNRTGRGGAIPKCQQPIPITQMCKVYRRDLFNNGKKELVYDPEFLESQYKLYSPISEGMVIGPASMGGSALYDYSIITQTSYAYSLDCNYDVEVSNNGIVSKISRHAVIDGTMYSNSQNPYVMGNNKLGGNIFWYGGPVTITVAPQSDAGSVNKLFIQQCGSSWNDVIYPPSEYLKKGEQWVLSEEELRGYGFLPIQESNDVNGFQSLLNFGYWRDNRIQYHMSSALDYNSLKTCFPPDHNHVYHSKARVYPERIADDKQRVSVAFEDIRFVGDGGVDADWNDLIFIFEGNISTTIDDVSESAKCGEKAKTNYPADTTFTEFGDQWKYLYCDKGNVDPSDLQTINNAFNTDGRAVWQCGGDVNGVSLQTVQCVASKESIPTNEDTTCAVKVKNINGGDKPITTVFQCPATEIQYELPSIDITVTGTPKATVYLVLQAVRRHDGKTVNKEMTVTLSDAPVGSDIGSAIAHFDFTPPLDMGTSDKRAYWDLAVTKTEYRK